MSNLNKVMLMGNLTRDPETRYTPKGTAVGDLSIAVNRRVNDGNDNWTDETTFVDITVWGNTAENAQKYLTKGRGIFVEGRLQLDTWEDKQSGQKRSRLKVVAESIQFLPSGKGESIGAPSQQPKREEPRNHAIPSNRPGANPTNFDDYGDEDDIPF